MLGSIRVVGYITQIASSPLRSCVLLFVVAEGDVRKYIVQLAASQHGIISSFILLIRDTDANFITKGGNRGVFIALGLAKEPQVFHLVPSPVVIAEGDMGGIYRIDECVFVEPLRVS